MRSQRVIAAAIVIALSGALAGCSTGVSNFDPSDLLDFLDTKKKLPGERKPVFPGGVPGLEQGVPKDLYKSNLEQRQQQEAAAAAAAAAQPAEEPKSKNAAKKGKQAARTPAPAAAPDGEAPEEEGSTAAARRLQKPRSFPANHGAAARCACAASRPTGPAATGCHAIPGADAQRHIPALI